MQSLTSFVVHCCWYCNFTEGTWYIILESDSVPFPNLNQSFQNTEMSVPDQNTEILRTLRYLSSVIESIKKPLGTQENPARVCRDLLDCRHKLKDGESHICLILKGCNGRMFKIWDFLSHICYTYLAPCICSLQYFMSPCLCLTLSFRLVLGRSKLGLCFWCLQGLLQLYCRRANLFTSSGL